MWLHMYVIYILCTFRYLNISVSNKTKPKKMKPGVLTGVTLQFMKDKVQKRANRSQPKSLRYCNINYKYWTDIHDFSCADYSRAQWCTRDGKYGKNWDTTWKPIRYYRVKEMSGWNCPECGCIGKYRILA